MREKKAKEGQKDTAEIYEKAIREIERITAASSTHRHEGDDQLEGKGNKNNLLLLQNGRLEKYLWRRPFC